MIGTPVQWLAIAAVGLVLFAPKLIPVFARILGRLVGMEMKRRYGISVPSAPRPIRNSRSEPQDVETVPVETPARIQSAPEPVQAPIPAMPTRSSLPLWTGSALVLGAVAVLLWYLLHAR